MVFYSTKSSEKVFHLPHCRIIRRIRKEYRKQFETAEEARASGYRMCSCCSPVGIRLRREQEVVNRFCRENSVSCRLDDGQLHVLAPKSEWRIIVSGKPNKLFLYHKNTYKKYEKNPGIIPGFHYQAARSTTIAGYLDYIVQHDAFRSRQKLKAKQSTKQNAKQNAWQNTRRTAKSMHNLRKNTWYYQHGTGNRRFNANQLYSVMDQVFL